MKKLVAVLSALVVFPLMAEVAPEYYLDENQPETEQVTADSQQNEPETDAVETAGTNVNKLLFYPLLHLADPEQAHVQRDNKQEQLHHGQ
jgi:hypothetical protein